MERKDSGHFSVSQNHLTQGYLYSRKGLVLKELFSTITKNTRNEISVCLWVRVGVESVLLGLHWY